MTSLVIVFAALMAFMGFLFVLSCIIKNNGIADVGYGIAALVTILTAETVAPVTTWQLSLVASLPFIWGVRLAIRIAYKNYGKPEDFRYKAWRESWGKTFLLRSFFQIYVLQGSIIFLVALPVSLAVLFPAQQISTTLVFAGVCVWIVGFLFESIGDYQLDQFIRNPLNKGTIMMSGLWRYSRHPNYFGESCMWWGIALAASGCTLYPVFVWISPLLITFLLLKVSGVPLLEKRWEGNPVWEGYKKRTSVFIPFPPKVR